MQDLATLAVESSNCDTDRIIDGVSRTANLLRARRTVRQATGSRSRIIRGPGALLPILAASLNVVLRDVLLTADEHRAISQGMADTSGPSTGQIALSAWLGEHAQERGADYANELHRHYRQRHDDRPSIHS